MAYLDSLSPQNEKGLGALGQEPGELVYENVLNLIGLLYPETDPDAVYAGLDKDPLILVARDNQGVEEDFGGALGFDLGDVMPFGCLRGEVGERHGSGEGGADALQVRAEGLRLRREVSA